ncbi:MAG: TlpA family protein disulfide reductase [bacterium]|nr:TlpA family protein disulfide reductase [bacterium]
MNNSLYSQEAAPKLVLTDLEGNSVSLDTIYPKGPTVLDFWATWCTPCKEALPHLNEIYEKYHKDGLQVLAISVDGTKTMDKVSPFIINEGYSFKVFMDPKSEALKAFGGKNIPHTVLVDRAGKIVLTKIGYLPGDEEVLEKKIVELLNTNESHE